jgi:hypothetical protein
LQKVEALATRPLTQARDIFDLHLLLSSGVVVDNGDPRLREYGDRAANNALGVSFGVFKAQVAFYLHPDTRARYDSADVWDEMVVDVSRRLAGPTK